DSYAPPPRMEKRVLVIDNYDSFTYNLVQYLRALGAECEVVLNDQVDVETLLSGSPQGILLSPGPGTPDDAGITLETIEKAGGQVPLLGVCLGHQSIGQAYGAKVVRAHRIMRGKPSPILHQ